MSFCECISWGLDAGRLAGSMLENLDIRLKLGIGFRIYHILSLLFMDMASWSIFAFLNHDVRCNFLS